MFAAINVKNSLEHNLHMKQKHDVAIKSMPTILGSVKKGRVFRWLEEMHLSETALLIRLCLASALGSGQQVLWGTSTTCSTSRVCGGWGRVERIETRKMVTWP